VSEVKDITRTTPPQTVTQTTIQWGNVIKGVAIVAAVALVAVVGFNVAAGFLLENGAIASQINGALGFLGEAAVQIGSLAWQGISFVGSGIMDLLSMIPGVNSMMTQGAIASAAPSQVAPIGGWIVGGGLAVGAALLLKAPQNLWHAVTNLFGQEKVAIAGKTEVIHQGHTLQDHNRPAKEPKEIPALPTTTETIVHADAAPQRSTTNWANRVPQADRSREAIMPRAGSHAEQIDSEQSLSTLSHAAR
jgi:hypothetical protein